MVSHVANTLVSSKPLDRVLDCKDPISNPIRGENEHPSPSMPDSFEHMPEPVVRMPNGALTSLAGNIDPHHTVAVADLILVQRRVRQTVERLVGDLQPDIVGLSIMTFQRETAKKIIALVQRLHPAVRIVVGGYDPSLAPEAYIDSSSVDFIVQSSMLA